MRIKKIVSTILATALITSLLASPVLANTSGLKKGFVNKFNQESPENRAQLVEKVKKINDNNQKIRELQKQARDKMAQIRAKIAALKQDPAALTPEKIAALKDKKTQLHTIKLALVKSKGKIGVQTKKLKVNKGNGNFAAVIVNLDNIIATQENRIKLLEDVNTQLDSLLASLQ